MNQRIHALLSGFSRLSKSRMKLRFKRRDRQSSLRALRLQIEPLEDRRMLAISLTDGGTWVEQGPGIIINGQVEGIPNQPVTGAVQGVAVNESTGVVYAGTVNGGIWNSKPNYDPTWKPMTDQKESPAIGAIAISPFDTQLIVAGTGSSSNGGGRGGRSVGVYVSDDGGSTWSHRGKNEFLDMPIQAIALTTSLIGTTIFDTILVGTRSGASTTTTGLYLSNNLGMTWETVSGGTGGLPVGPVTDIEIDPGIPGDNNHPRTVYVAMPQSGIFKSTDLVTWTETAIPFIQDNFRPPTTTTFGTSELLSNIGLTSFGSGSTFILYAGLIENNNLPSNRDHLVGVIRSDTNGRTWTKFGGGLPRTTELQSDGVDNDGDGARDTIDDDRDAGIHPGGQGWRNFSFAANTRTQDVLYMGGDRQPSLTKADGTSPNDEGCSNFSGRLYRGTTPAAGARSGWTSIVCSAAGGTSPHADSRSITFVKGNGGPETDRLIETDDGGIYILNNPDGVTSTPAVERKWVSFNGSSFPLKITEVNSVAYDRKHNLFFTGQQDTGTSEQVTPGGINWTQAQLDTNFYQQGDGQKQLYREQDGKAVHYSLGNNYDSFYRRQYSKVGGLVKQDNLPALNSVDLLAQKVAPLLNPSNNLIKTFNALVSGIGTVEAENVRQGFRILPMEFNTIVSEEDRLLWGLTSLFESENSGTANLKIEDGAALTGTRKGVLTAVAYGGRGINGGGFLVDSPEVIYAARERNIAVRKAGAKFGAGLSNPAGFDLPDSVYGSVRDIVVNPDEWRIAYAIDSGEIYRTKDGSNGTQWEKLKSGNLLDLTSEIFSIEIFNPSSNPNDEILLVGGRGGVFYCLNPRANVPVWRELGGGLSTDKPLPNAAATDVHFDVGTDGLANTADDLIYVGMYGRGVWRLNNPLNALSGILTIDGTSNQDNIILKLSSPKEEPLLLVTINGVTESFSYQMLDKVIINGLGGKDTITLDTWCLANLLQDKPLLFKRSF